MDVLDIIAGIGRLDASRQIMSCEWAVTEQTGDINILQRHVHEVSRRRRSRVLRCEYGAVVAAVFVVEVDYALLGAAKETQTICRRIDDCIVIDNGVKCAGKPQRPLTHIRLNRHVRDGCVFGQSQHNIPHRSATRWGGADLDGSGSDKAHMRDHRIQCDRCAARRL